MALVHGQNNSLKTLGALFSVHNSLSEIKPNVAQKNDENIKMVLERSQNSISLAEINNSVLGLLAESCD